MANKKDLRKDTLAKVANGARLYFTITIEGQTSHNSSFNIATKEIRRTGNPFGLPENDGVTVPSSYSLLNSGFTTRNTIADAMKYADEVFRLAINAGYQPLPEGRDLE